jgi:hypothetical protein
MRPLLTLIFVITITAGINAQTTGGTKQSPAQRRANTQEKKRVQRGTGQYYGSKDTTPGSPMGTGGAGGDMSGSPAGSAIETDDQTSNVDADSESSNKGGSATNASDTTVKSPATNKARSNQKTRRHTL